MAVKAIGEITENLNDGLQVKVDWKDRFEPPREWYFYTGRSSVWKMKKDDWAGTKKSRNFGFVVFEDENAVSNALSEGHEIDDRVVEVKRADPDAKPKATPTEHCNTDKIFVGGLNQEVDKDALNAYFAEYGEIVDAQVMLDRDTNRSRGFGFVRFVDSDAVKKVMEKFTEHEINGKWVEVKPAVPQADAKGGKSGKGGKGKGKSKGKSGKNDSGKGAENNYGQSGKGQGGKGQNQSQQNGGGYDPSMYNYGYGAGYDPSAYGQYGYGSYGYGGYGYDMSGYNSSATQGMYGGYGNYSNGSSAYGSGTKSIMLQKRFFIKIVNNYHSIFFIKFCIAASLAALADQMAKLPSIPSVSTVSSLFGGITFDPTAMTLPSFSPLSSPLNRLTSAGRLVLT